jgi:ATP-binding cassette subfamily B protein RaxB
MGSSFSGGQKQRILMARAIYKEPKLLILDEATSHLDSKNELFVNQSFDRIPIIRIIVAHRKETVSFANQVFVMDEGKIIRTCKPENYL